MWTIVKKDILSARGSYGELDKPDRFTNKRGHNNSFMGIQYKVCYQVFLFHGRTIGFQLAYHARHGQNSDSTQSLVCGTGPCKKKCLTRTNNWDGYQAVSHFSKFPHN